VGWTVQGLNPSGALIQAGPGAHPASNAVGTRSFPGVKWLVCAVNHPPPSSADVRERVELYSYATSVTSGQAVG
jgi:hypothetical protein